MTEDKQHKNDMYGNIDARSESDEGVLPPIPAATVVQFEIQKKVMKSLC